MRISLTYLFYQNMEKHSSKQRKGAFGEATWAEISN